MEALASLVKAKLTVRLVDAAGNLLADTDASPGVPGLRTSENNDGRRLEAAITPKVRLRSSGAILKLDERSEPTRDGKLPKMGLTFFDHADHGDLFGGAAEWVPY